MDELLTWFTDMENTKPCALVLFFVTFALIVLYVYTGKKRKERFESYRNIPFEEDDDAASSAGKEQ
ncbi:MAG: cbb3-type cytochrome c oxidase subunit 3 [Pseudomonadota bacterium]|nr:MAG: cbb3-type cytochrome c oxidase subunit 3 [Pseudomonadota bacterium]